MSPYDEELHRRVDEVLHYVWDPAGVSNSPVARHDYDDFLPTVFAMVRDQASPQAIAQYLNDLEEKEYDLEPDTEMTAHVADILIEWQEILSARHGVKA